MCLCACVSGARVSEKLHGKVQERTINTNLLPARWATSSQVGVVSIAVNAIYLMYWPITTSPLCAPAEGSPAVSQQGHRCTIDWGVVLFLQADPHSCFCLGSSFIPPSLYTNSSPAIYPFSSACSSFSFLISPPACLCPPFPASVASLSEVWLQAVLSGHSCKNQ